MKRIYILFMIVLFSGAFLMASDLDKDTLGGQTSDYYAAQSQLNDVAVSTGITAGRTTVLEVSTETLKNVKLNNLPGVVRSTHVFTDDTYTMATLVLTNLTTGATVEFQGNMIVSTSAVFTGDVNIGHKLAINSGVISTSTLLYVKDFGIGTPSNYYGMWTDVRKWTGVTDENDSFIGYNNRMYFDFNGGVLGFTYLQNNKFTLSEGTIGTVGNPRHLYGGRYEIDLDSGTVTGQVDCIQIKIDQETPNRVGNDIKGIDIDIDADGDTAGTVYAMYFNEGDGVDYYMYQTGGTAPSVLAGTLTVRSINITNASYLCGHISTNTATSVTAGEWTKVEGTFTLDDVGNFTVDGATITYTGSQTKIFSVNVAISARSDTTNTTCHWTFYKSGALDTDYQMQRKISVAGDVGAIPLIGLFPLSPGDELSIWIRTDKSAVITQEHTIITISPVN